MALPLIIQGGMGVAVSNWVLANAVASRGHMGVISGTGLDTVVSRRLQLGDPTGALKRAFDAFPVPEMARRVWSRYFVPEGKAADAPFRAKPVTNIETGQAGIELTVVSNFVEVWLAKQGHNGPIGINLLEKIQLPHLACLFGAMLAGVDYVLMGAGIPRQIPAVLDSLSQLEDTSYRVDVAGALSGETYLTHLRPRSLVDWPMTELPRPQFLAIVSSSVLAQSLIKKCVPPVDGFVVEGPLAGGHNAPPRGAMVLNENNEPVYGARDVPDLEAIRDLGAPFWMAGAYGKPGMIEKALEAGAQGVQVGTAFAFCNESGIDPDIKREVIQKVLRGEVSVKTDPVASPTGFPFKVVQMEGTLSTDKVYGERQRICDLGYLRTPYRKEDGSIGYRCASEPVDDYIAKGGELSETVGRKCICNGLISTIGLGQRRKDGTFEPPILTAGDELVNLAQIIPPGRDSYSVDDVLAYLLSNRAVAVG
ncbi:MAG: nitronate monooxygenase [Fimbriimonadaceae bacterium]|nr:nitronate monooxygenase [Fimbriimonadaceae bacterium]QYK55563.1 MAG: nitronate monooxygenase [Fimbriimonadaceae bacterium]